ncbi:MAG TPA: methyltransferase domain-containing protein [Caulobacter sp.]|nr:methyltransferase domain-containing protein [Caulobacter sp.]
MTDQPNAAQIDYWNDAAGQTWARLQELLDHQIAPLGRRAMAALAPAEGEAVVDVGCGCGETTLELAKAVGPRGRVLGLDISRPMLEVAERRLAGVGQAEVREADAQVADLGAGTWDAVFSRFGVMFFADPAAAFANLARALRPGGRVAFVCWRPLTENSWMTIPLGAALTVVPPQPPSDPLAPGPFAFADPDRVRGILSGAGFEGVEIVPHDQKIGARTLEDALVLAQKVGPSALLLRENPDAREAIVAAQREALTPLATPEGVLFDSATWIVTARKA